jgi:hypothetical protein
MPTTPAPRLRTWLQQRASSSSSVRTKRDGGADPTCRGWREPTSGRRRPIREGDDIAPPFGRLAARPAPLSQAVDGRSAQPAGDDAQRGIPAAAEERVRRRGPGDGAVTKGEADDGLARARGGRAQLHGHVGGVWRERE